MHISHLASATDHTTNELMGAKLNWKKEDKGEAVE